MRLLNDLHPTESIYYLGYVILGRIKKTNKSTLESLFSSVREVEKVTFGNFVLALDWLYCLNVVKYDNQGFISLCI